MSKLNKKVIFRAPFSEPNINNYDTSPEFSRSRELEKEIDKKTKRLTKKGVDISISPTYLLNSVRDHTTRLFNKLDTFHRENLESIHNLFSRREADLIDFQTTLESIDDQIELAQQDYEFMEAVYRDHNPLSQIKKLHTQIIETTKEVSYNTDERE